jgi:hypothetical protein
LAAFVARRFFAATVLETVFESIEGAIETVVRVTAIRDAGGEEECGASLTLLVAALRSRLTFDQAQAQSRGGTVPAVLLGATGLQAVPQGFFGEPGAVSFAGRIGSLAAIETVVEELVDPLLADRFVVLISQTVSVEDLGLGSTTLVAGRDRFEGGGGEQALGIGGQTGKENEEQAQEAEHGDQGERERLASLLAFESGFGAESRKRPATGVGSDVLDRVGRVRRPGKQAGGG